MSVNPSVVSGLMTETTQDMVARFPKVDKMRKYKSLILITSLILLSLAGKEQSCLLVADSVGTTDKQCVEDRSLTLTDTFLPGFSFAQIFDTEFDARDEFGNKIVNPDAVQVLRELFLSNIVILLTDSELPSVANTLKLVSKMLGLLNKYFTIPWFPRAFYTIPVAFFAAIKKISELIQPKNRNYNLLFFTKNPGILTSGHSVVYFTILLPIIFLTLSTKSVLLRL